ncbi:hypothetical protein OUZ56_026355 [Daphnia magna]|uniref:Uncharacterized protein n=1 Tax=Daphnia magna TaxID=35525 RepID=A0ABQ9ZLJ2_9CRUS|nr:hypothetical protein OUZ56_026355 [Daphnia magna]
MTVRPNFQTMFSKVSVKFKRCAMATNERIICLFLSQYAMEMLDSSTERGDSVDEEENETSLAVITSIEIERHPRQALQDYSYNIPLYEKIRSEIAFHGGCDPMTIDEYLGNQGGIRLLADKFNQTESSIWKSIGEFCHYMYEKQSDSIEWPTRQEIMAIS